MIDPCPCGIPHDSSHAATTAAISRAIRERVHLAGSALDRRMLAVALRRTRTATQLELFRAEPRVAEQASDYLSDLAEREDM